MRRESVSHGATIDGEAIVDERVVRVRPGRALRVRRRRARYVVRARNQSSWKAMEGDDDLDTMIRVIERSED